MNVRLLALSLVICGAITGCYTKFNTADSRQPIYPGSVFVDYGSQGKESIQIYLWGDVQHPGVYFLPRNSSLMDLIMRIGTLGPGLAAPAAEIAVIRWNHGVQKIERYKIKRASPTELSAVPLEPEMNVVVGEAAIRSMEPKTKPAIYPGSMFVGQGSPGDDMIKIYLAGDVQVPGVYYLPRNSTLLDMMMRIGTAASTSHFAPFEILVKWQQGETIQNAKYQWRKSPKDDLSKIPLADGMVLCVPQRI